MKTKEINRTISFGTRDVSSPYRCKYGNKNDFEKLRINISFEGRIADTYEIDSQYLPDRDSISFKAVPADSGFIITSWSPKEVMPYLKKRK